MTASYKNKYHDQCVTFKLDTNLIGINILSIREIVPCRVVTGIAQSPDYVMGLMNLRGQILTILDIGILLGFEQRKIGSNSHVIIFKHRDTGFIVDKIGDVLGIEKEQVEEIPANMQSGIKEYMDYVVNLKDDILMLLDADKILSVTASQNKGR